MPFTLFGKIIPLKILLKFGKAPLDDELGIPKDLTSLIVLGDFCNSLATLIAAFVTVCNT